MTFLPFSPGPSTTHWVAPWGTWWGHHPMYQLRHWRQFVPLLQEADVQSPVRVCCTVSRAHLHMLRRKFAMSVHHCLIQVLHMLQEADASSKATSCGASPQFAWRSGFHSARMTAGRDSSGQSGSKKPHCSFLTGQNHSHAVCSRP